MLRSFGLGEAAEVVYQQMLRYPDAGKADIAARLGWDEHRVAEAMDELARLSLVRPSWERPGVLRAVAPEVGIAALLSRQEEELRRKQSEFESIRSVMHVVAAEYADLRRGRLVDGVEFLKGIDDIRLRIEALAAECRHEVMGFAPAGAQSRASLEASRPLDQEVLARGVRMRTVYLESIINDPATLRYARWLVGEGAQVRVAPTLPPRMLIYDRAVALVAIDAENSRRGALLLRCTGVVSALYELFELIWQPARQIGEERGSGGDGLTAQEMAILRLLAQGHTDEVVARRLGVSVRTGRRITASLVERLGARSRFQAGALAAVRGWIDEIA